MVRRLACWVGAPWPASASNAPLTEAAMSSSTATDRVRQNRRAGSTSPGVRAVRRVSQPVATSSSSMPIQAISGCRHQPSTAPPSHPRTTPADAATSQSVGVGRKGATRSPAVTRNATSPAQPSRQPSAGRLAS